jgi:hypothetical protein
MPYNKKGDTFCVAFFSRGFHIWRPAFNQLVHLFFIGLSRRGHYPTLQVDNKQYRATAILTAVKAVVYIQELSVAVQSYSHIFANI